MEDGETKKVRQRKLRREIGDKSDKITAISATAILIPPTGYHVALR